jgi:hypothetical protein
MNWNCENKWCAEAAEVECLICESVFCKPCYLVHEHNPDKPERPDKEVGGRIVP